GDKKPSRYWDLFDVLAGANGAKEVFLLTATPVNNSLHDFRHMIELFSRQKEDYFKDTLGIHYLRGHFVNLDKKLQATRPKSEVDSLGETNLVEAEQVLTTDAIFDALVVQRSRAYVQKSQVQQGFSSTLFPVREHPQVAPYSVKKTYGRLLDMVEKAFKKEKPLFVLGIYYPLAYYKGPDVSVDPMLENRQKQVVSLIRTQFLKRFESSAKSFELSCARLMKKLLAWLTKYAETDHEKRRLDRFLAKEGDLIGHVQKSAKDLWDLNEEEAEEDFITEEMLEAVEDLPPNEYKVDEMIDDCFDDLEQIAEFLRELQQFQAKHDDKLNALVKLLKKDSILSKHKVLVFTEFADTAHYLKQQLKEAGIDGVFQIDSGTKGDRSSILERFAPYYNGTSSAEIEARGEKEIRVLISTDVLSEGLNLQDATRLINYDLHWNPVRLMQRIGRVDRRMNPAVEKQMLEDHPEMEKVRGTVAYWNFLPPDDLEELLKLYNRVSNKTLVISKTFGIEGGKLLHPDDDLEGLKEFNQEYEGETSPTEELLLEYQGHLKDHPELAERLSKFPLRVFSGKQHPKKDSRAAFFCYRIPHMDREMLDEEGEPTWTEEAGETRWYLYNLEDCLILESSQAIADFIRCQLQTPRHCVTPQETLSEVRRKIEKHIKNTVLKQLQAPLWVKPLLKAWMELS
ncbi:MAG TPA: helicase-related protein, partial [bacterium]|nr:helicase-related protein [bacterium]